MPSVRGIVFESKAYHFFPNMLMKEQLEQEEPRRSYAITGLAFGRTVSGLCPYPDPTDRSQYQNPFRSDPGSQNPGRSMLQSGTDTIWKRKV